jgi:hypothetical protein
MAFAKCPASRSVQLAQNCFILKSFKTGAIMPLVDVRRDFIKYSGRYDLVIDQIDWADNGADFFIRAGNKWLDRFGDIAKSVARYFEPLTDGRWYALIPSRSIREVWISNAEGCKWKLRKLDFIEMRKKYPCNPAQTQTGMPRHYAIMPIRALPEIQSTTIVDVYDAVTFGNEYIAGAFLLRNAETADVYTVLIDRAHQLTAIPGIMPVQFDETKLFDIFSGAIYTSLVFPAHNNPDITMYLSVDMSGQLFADVVAPIGPSLPVLIPFTMRSIAETLDEIQIHSIGQISVVPGPDILTPPDYKFTGLMFMPPAQNGMELEVLCTALQYELNLDTDENYWTETNPHILVMAACRQLEISYRNNAGVTDWENAIKTEILGLEYDYAEEESNEFTNMEG